MQDDHESADNGEAAMIYTGMYQEEGTKLMVGRGVASLQWGESSDFCR